MPDKFAFFETKPADPARGGAAVVPTDGLDLAQVTRAVYVGGAGNLTVRMADGAALTFTAVPVGSLLPIRVDQVQATGTTATNILALW
jgi:hypothetical protein